MRIEPVKALGRSNMKRKRRYRDEPEQPREKSAFQLQLVPQEAHIEEDHDRFIARYRPNATFLAHLIATRDGDPQTRYKRQTEPEIGTSRYRETAASPRKREAGHLIAIEY
ncbi:hypothetical protein [Roseibium sp.]|uniref:hypothetical protein n=1 Tax=Roseibium sp. TaxID=1936156 RepID=UPI003264A8A7